MTRTDDGLEFAWETSNPGEYPSFVHIGNPPVIGSDGIIYGYYESPDLATVPMTPAGREGRVDDHDGRPRRGGRPGDAAERRVQEAAPVRELRARSGRSRLMSLAALRDQVAAANRAVDAAGLVTLVVRQRLGRRSRRRRRWSSSRAACRAPTYGRRTSSRSRWTTAASSRARSGRRATRRRTACCTWSSRTSAASSTPTRRRPRHGPRPAGRSPPSARPTPTTSGDRSS